MVSPGRPILWRGIAALLLFVALVAGASAHTIDGYEFSNHTQHTISNAGAGLTYYQVAFTLNNSTGTNAGGTIYTNGTTKADWSDIRFTSLGGTVYPYWIESLTPTTAYVWTNVTSIPNGNSTIVVYYDSDTAIGESNGPATFRFFDTFSTLDTTKWTVSGSTVSVANSVLTVSGTSQGRVTSKTSYARNTSVRMRLQTNTYNRAGDWGYENFHFITNTGLGAQYITGSKDSSTWEYTGLGTGYTGYHVWEVSRTAAASQKFFIDNTLVDTDTVRTSTTASYLQIAAWASGDTLYTDWILVRSLAATEPTHGDYDTTIAPEAEFLCIPQVGVAPLTVNVTDTSSGNPTSWTWNWGDGTPNGTSQEMSHTYTSVGNYTITLTATNALGSGEIIKADYVTVASVPPVDFTMTSDTTAQMMYLSFSGSAVNFTPTTWSWTFGDGGTSALQTPTHRYLLATGASRTDYDVVLTASDGVRTGTMTKTVSVHNLTPFTMTEPFDATDAWTFTSVQGTAASGKNEMTTPTTGQVRLNVYGENTPASNFGRVHYNTTRLVYAATDAVTFRLNMSTSLSQTAGYYDDAEVYADFGSSSVLVRDVRANTTAGFKWYTVEYDGAGHARVGTGPWQPVAVTGTWSPKVDAYMDYMYGYGGNARMYVDISTFTAVRANGGFTVDADHADDSPLSVTPSSTAYNATGYVWNWGDGTADSTAQSPGAHSYAAHGLYRLRLQTTSDTYGMESDTATGIAVGDYGFDARPYAAQYGNVSATANVDDKAVGTYRLDWAFGGNPDASVTSHTSLSAVGQFNQTGTKHLALVIENTTSGARYLDEYDVSVTRKDAPAGMFDLFTTHGTAWTYTSVTGSSNSVSYLTPGQVRFSLYTTGAPNDKARVHYNNTNLRYNATDAVTFKINISTSHSVGWDRAYGSRLYLDIGSTSVVVKDLYTSSTAWGWYTVEYDGAGHARVWSGATPGVWQDVTVTGDWSPRLNAYVQNRDIYGNVYGVAKTSYVDLTTFTATRTNGAFTVDTDHGDDSPLSVTPTDTSFNATAWSWSFGDGATNTTQSPGAHSYASHGLYRLRLQTTSDTYGMDMDQSRGVAVGDYGVDARPYAAKYGNVSVTAKVDNKAVGTYRIDWLFEGNSVCNVGTSSTLSTVGVFNQTGTKNLVLWIRNATTGAEWTTTEPVGVLRIDPPFQVYDSFDSLTAWTFTVITGTALTDYNSLSQPTAGQARLKVGTNTNPSYPIGNVHYNNTNLVYNATDAVTFAVNMSTSTSVLTSYYDIARVSFDIGSSSIVVRDAKTAGTAWVTYRIEYDGAGHARVWTGATPGVWQDVTVTGDWKPRLNVYQDHGTGWNNLINLYVDIASFTATRTNGVFVATPHVGRVPLEVAFSDTGWNMTAWMWNFDDGVTNSTAEAPTHTYTEIGLYSPSLTAYSDTYGMDQVALMTDYINIGQGPEANFVGAPRYGTAPLNVQFTDLSANATGWNWSFGDGNYSSLQNPSHEYAANGNYTVSLNATNIYSYNVTTVTNYVGVGDAPIADFNVNVSIGVAPLNVSFTVNYTGGPDATDWWWDIDNDGTVEYTTQNCSHTYTDNGNYSVNYTAANLYGSSTMIKNNLIEVGDPPVTDFTATPRIGTKPLEVQFNDTSAGNATAWSWSFGDGTTSFVQNATNVYGANGLYNVSLNASNHYGSYILTKNNFIDVGDGPAANFTANRTVVAVPGTVKFTDASANTTTWSWLFGDGDTSAQQSPSHTYAVAGLYTVSLNASNTYGSVWLNRTAYIDAGHAPAADFSADATVVAIDQVVAFTDLSTNATGWNWSFGDGATAATRNASHAYAANGSYTVSLNATNAYGAGVATKAGYVAAWHAPVADFAGNVTGGVAPLTVEFGPTLLDYTVQNGWYWAENESGLVYTYGDGSPSDPRYYKVVFDTPGVYDVGMKAVNPATSAWVNKTDYVTVVGGVTADFAANATAGTPPMTVQFTSAATNATVWNWSFGDGDYSALEHPVHIYALEGLYTVSLNASNAYDFAVETKTNYVQAGEPPVAGFVANRTLGAVPFAVRFADQSTNATSYAWDIDNDGETDYMTANVTHTYTQPGTYTVNQTVTNLFGPSTEVKTGYIVVGNPITADFTANRTVVAVDDGVGFTSLATNATNWSWDFGDGDPNPEFDENPWHIYLEPGIYTVTLNASSMYDFDVETKTAYIDAGYAPTAAFTANRTVVAVPGAVAFTDASTGNPTGWTWVWHDGTANSSTQNPTHVYTAPDTYDVQLLAANQYGASWSNESGYIDAGYAPIAGGFASEENVTPGREVDFTDTSEFVPSHWNWSFGDGEYSIEPNTTHFYTSTGTFTVRLNVANTYGTDETVIDTINVGNEPVASFTANDTIGAPGHGVAFTDTSVTEGAASYTWNFGDGSPLGITQNPVHVYDATGLYTVSLRVWTPFGVSYENKTEYIDIGNPPVAAFGGVPLSGAHPLPVAFTDASTENPTAWSWDFGDGSAVSALQNPTHTYATAGTYTVVLTASNPYATDTETKAAYVTVGTAPTAAFSVDTQAAIANQVITFTDESVGSLPMTVWNWDFGDGTTSQNQNPTHAYASTGTFTVSLNVANAYGIDSETKVGYITIATAATASFTAIPLSGPSPLTVQFTDTSQGATVWAWDFDGDGIADSTDQNPSYTFTTDGFYDVALTATNPFGGTTMTKSSYVMAGPLTARNMRAAFSMDVKTGPKPLTVQFTDTSTVAAGSGEYARLWDFGDGSAPSAESNPVHNYTDEGRYDVELTITSATETDTASSAKAVYVYPSQALAPHATTTFGIYATQMAEAEFNPIDIAEILPSAYTDIMPMALFWGLIFAVIFFMIWIRNGNVILPAILGIIFVGCLMTFLDIPPEFEIVGQVFLIVAIAAMFFTALMGRRR